MRKRNRDINIFSISMLDVLTGAMGIFLIMLILLLPFYKKGITLEEILEKLTGYEQKNTRLQGEKEQLQKRLSNTEDRTKQLAEDKEKLSKQLVDCRVTNESLTGGKTELSALLTTCQDESAQNIAEKKTLTGELEQCQNQSAQYQKELEQATGRFAECQNQTEQSAKENTRLAAQNAQLAGQLEQCQGANEQLTGGKSQLTDLLAKCQEENSQTKTSQSAQQEQLEQCQDQAVRTARDRIQVGSLLEQCQEQLSDVRKLGFAVNEKKIVFVVDISGSMKNDDKIYNVTTGIKMQIATMDESYETDIVFFPNKPANSDYGYLWGQLTQVTTSQKYSAYQFLSDLEAAGSTPTESVLNFVFEHYPEAGAIILFSDGAPAVGANEDLPWNELEGMLTRITEKNHGSKKINAIGVGPEFRDEQSTANKVKFLKMLAEQNGGFYTGF